MPPTDGKTLSTIRAGLRCRCPRCGEGRLFRRFLKIADRCDRCGLDYGFADPADGPAFFVMSGVGVVVTTIWAIWAVMAQPPIWAQIAVAFPAMIGGCLGTLRPVKAWLVAEQLSAWGYQVTTNATTDPEQVRELMGLLRRIQWSPERLRFVQNVLRDLAACDPVP